jgi:hypothetical protein
MDFEAQEVKNMLKNSLEYSIYKNEIIVYGVMIFAAFIVFGVIAILTQIIQVLLVVFPLLLIYVPSLINNVRKMSLIMKFPEHCLICETILSNPQPTFSASIYFTVKIKDSDNMPMEQETNAIGTTRGLLKPHFSELVEKKALVSYNELTQEVVVIRLI